MCLIQFVYQTWQLDHYRSTEGVSVVRCDLSHALPPVCWEKGRSHMSFSSWPLINHFLSFPLVTEKKIKMLPSTVSFPSLLPPHILLLKDQENILRWPCL